MDIHAREVDAAYGVHAPKRCVVDGVLGDISLYHVVVQFLRRSRQSPDPAQHPSSGRGHHDASVAVRDYRSGS